MIRDFHDHPDWQAMFLALAEDPLNPVRRLVMADWLDEFGTEDAANRAKVIRIAHHPDWPVDGIYAIERTPGDRWAQDPDGTVVWVPNLNGELRLTGATVSLPEMWAERFGCQTYRVKKVERQASGGILPGRATLLLSPLPAAGQLNGEWVRVMNPFAVKEWIRRETEWDTAEMSPLHAASDTGLRETGFFMRFMNAASLFGQTWMAKLVQRMPLTGFADWYLTETDNPVVWRSDVEGDWIVRLRGEAGDRVTGHYRWEMGMLGNQWPAFRSRRRAVEAASRALIDAARHLAKMTPLAWPELPPDVPEPAFGPSGINGSFVEYSRIGIPAAVGALLGAACSSPPATT